MALTVKQAEDFLTNRISGITVMNVSVEYPERKEVLYIEGEKDYFVFINQEDTYEFTDGQKNVRLTNTLEDGTVLTEEEFLDRVAKIILSEE